MNQFILLTMFEERNTLVLAKIVKRLNFIKSIQPEIVICGHCHSHGGMSEKLNKTTVQRSEQVASFF